ncbi:hypothetical protein M0R72_11515 [Candidatus Pacearchaeota archaeon]|jgi:hypothetical protein|nr:hypothetical protein [Candidatus Pacearchaeota archaeon]
MKYWLIIGGLLIAAALFFILRPMEITQPEIKDDCGCLCMSWETNQDAQCKVTFCEEGMCYTSILEPEYSTSHYYSISGRSIHGGITITAIGRFGQAKSLTLKGGVK